MLNSATVRHFHPHLPPAVNIMSGGAVQLSLNLLLFNILKSFHKQIKCSRWDPAPTFPVAHKNLPAGLMRAQRPTLKDEEN